MLAQTVGRGSSVCLWETRLLYHDYPSLYLYYPIGRAPLVECSTPNHPMPAPPDLVRCRCPPPVLQAGVLCSDTPHLYRHPLPTCIITGAQEEAPRSSTASPAPTAETHGPHTCGVRAARWRWRQSRREGARQPWQYARMLGWGIRDVRRR